MTGSETRTSERTSCADSSACSHTRRVRRALKRDDAPCLLWRTDMSHHQHVTGSVFLMSSQMRPSFSHIACNIFVYSACVMQFVFFLSLSRLTLEDTQQWSQSLERLLDSKYGLAAFRNFLKSEYSDENIEFWLTCEDYKKIKSSFRMASKAKKIYEQFIKAESPKEYRYQAQRSSHEEKVDIKMAVLTVLWNIPENSFQ
ncbi:uncharacterized protein LOC144062788 isoform X2 [Vanacampus margaritifer]